jgi:hypothetical protein
MNRNSDTSNHSSQNQNLNDIAFTLITMEEIFLSNIWILDSGASNHFCRSMEGLKDVWDIDASIKIGNGDTMRATKVGNLKCEVTQLDGKKFIVSINDVKFVPNLCVNLFSLNKALKKGFIISNEANIVSLILKHLRLKSSQVNWSFHDYLGRRTLLLFIGFPVKDYKCVTIT